MSKQFLWMRSTNDSYFEEYAVDIYKIQFVKKVSYNKCEVTIDSGKSFYVDISMDELVNLLNQFFVDYCDRGVRPTYKHCNYRNSDNRKARRYIIQKLQNKQCN